jgi:nucleotide-binding universal stress UspA family protein
MSSAFADVTVPVDPSATARRGIDFAIEFAQPGRRLHFCSVVDPTGVLVGGALGTPVDPTPIVATLKADAQRVCDDAVAAAHGSGIKSDAEVIFGTVSASIRNYARANRSDVLILGTHARTGAARFVFGSIAESLIEDSAIPVIVTHVDDVAGGTGPITVAVDSSPPAALALTAAVDLALATGRALSIVNVVESGRTGWSTAEPILNDAAETVRSAGLEFELVTLEGPPAETIVATAQRRGSSMIVIGTHGRKNAARLFLGSVAAAVLERARVPVMVVRGR